MARHKNWQWDIPNDHITWEMAQAEVLMDIREELQRLNNLLGCENFVAVPFILRQIRNNTTKKKARRRA